MTLGPAVLRHTADTFGRRLEKKGVEATTAAVTALRGSLEKKKTRDEATNRFCDRVDATSSGMLTMNLESAEFFHSPAFPDFCQSGFADLL